MFKAIEPKKQRHNKPSGVKAYVRVSARMILINSEAGKMWGDHKTCNVSIDVPGKTMVFSPGGQWNLSSVCETKNARRIETRTAVNSFLEAGFPRGLLGKYLPCFVDMSGCLVVGLMVDYDRLAV